MLARAQNQGCHLIGSKATLESLRLVLPGLQPNFAEKQKFVVLWQYWELNGLAAADACTGFRTLGQQQLLAGRRSMLDSQPVQERAHQLGFELVGIASAEPTLESLFYPEWLERGYHGEMAYLEGRRGAMRADPRTLLPSARSVICVGMVYNAPAPYSTAFASDEAGWVSRYAWGRDYHEVLRDRLDGLAGWLQTEYGEQTQCKVCVDTAPLLERAYAHRAGLGWIGKNCCLINERHGSWLFLGEILTSLALNPSREAPFRCGTCRRCIDACPTDAFVELGGDQRPTHALDSRLCIAYWTIELRGSIPEEHRASTGHHLFGCDICQDVCPWNNPNRAAVTGEKAFQPSNREPDLEKLAALSEEEFNARFSNSPIERSRYAGFLRNVAVAMGNSGNAAFQEALERLASSTEPTVAEHASWALRRLRQHANRAVISEQGPPRPEPDAAH